MNKSIIAFFSFIPLIAFILAGYTSIEYREEICIAALVYSVVYTGMSLGIFSQCVLEKLKPEHQYFVLPAYMVILITIMLSFMMILSNTFLNTDTLAISTFMFIVNTANFSLLLLSGLNIKDLLSSETNNEADHE